MDGASASRTEEEGAVMMHSQIQKITTHRYQEQFSKAMKEKGNHVTCQRLAIAGVLHAMCGHPTVNELHDELKKEKSNIGLATIYRTVKLLKEAGLVMELYGDENSVRLEAVNALAHHDHFICRKCGAVMEIRSRELEQAQSELAREYGFFPEQAAHCIYGLCSICYSCPTKIDLS